MGARTPPCNMVHLRATLHHMSKTIRQSVTIAAEHGPAIEYLCEKLGKSKSAIISDIVNEALPELYQTVKSFEETVQKGDNVPVKEQMIIKNLKSMIKLLEES